MNTDSHPWVRYFPSGKHLGGFGNFLRKSPWMFLPVAERSRSLTPIRVYLRFFPYWIGILLCKRPKVFPAREIPTTNGKYRAKMFICGFSLLCESLRSPPLSLPSLGTGSSLGTGFSRGQALCGYSPLSSNSILT